MANRLLVATRKGLFTVERNGNSNGHGTTWAVKGVTFLGDTLTIVLPDPRDGTLYAALHHGHFGSKIHRSRDGGTIWQEVATPVYPKQPEGEVDVNPMSQKPLEWKLDRIWALEAGHRSEPGVLWCGTLPGGLFRSADGGDSWELVRPLWDRPERKHWFGGGAELPALHSILVNPDDGRRIIVGVSCGGVWRTQDGGKTWQLGGPGMWAAYMPPEGANDPNIQDVHRVVQCATRPECLWAQHHNGVFRSTDGADSWQEVKNVQPSVFGFAVAVHPRDPDTAWFVPAIKDERRVPVDGRVVVARTLDGGATFEVLRRGLPQEHAYDLTFRHGLDVDGNGTTLAFGTTTGSLWISEDGGDSWQHVTAHLPPVHCVRFAANAA